MSTNLQKIAGGTGCDIVTSDDSDFTPRKGKIYAIYVRENDTQIAYIKEDNKGTVTTITNRSWIGGDTDASTGGSDEEAFPTLITGELYIPDFPVTGIELTSGSVIVYYDEYPWSHFRR